MTRKPIFVCNECGATHSKWSGRCDACGAWNAIAEEAGLAEGPAGRSIGPARGRRIALGDLAVEEPPLPRSLSGIGELDRVLGGGMVPASAILVGGDPGIGKSTLLLQAAAAFASQGAPAIYISGEEAAAQIRMRAVRLGLAQAPLRLATETNLRDILTTLEAERPRLAVIDSIQTMWADHVDSAPGSVAQVRAAAHELVTFAKRRGVAVVLVGHVTKDGQIAGPRVVEHMVDTVLYFEGERGHQFRILRAVKNRFGPADEIGVFEMTGAGLAEVTNPSALFLSERDSAVSGSAVFAGVEGTRPLLVEIQALVAPSSFGTSRRTVVGWDQGRLATVLAVLESRCGIGFGPSDVYLNVAGGLRITEPAADLAVAAALVSARQDIPLPRDAVFFGEISLSGALRPAAQAEARLREAAEARLRRRLRAGPAGAANELHHSPGCGSRRIHGEVLRHDRPIGRGTRMQGFTIVDGIVLAVIVISAVLAYARGLVRESLSILGWIVAALAGISFAPMAEPLLREVPVLKDIIGTSCELGILAGFAAIFAVALIIVSLFTPLIAGAVQNSAIGPIDQGLGFLFGIVRGVLLIVIALVVYTRVFGGAGGVAQVDNSHSIVVFSGLEARIAAMLPEDAPQWFAGQYDRLTQSCS